MPKQEIEVERLGLARRLHETLAQDLAAIGYQLDALIGDETLSQHHRNELRDIRLHVMKTARGFRDEIYRLRAINRSDLHSLLAEILNAQSREIDLSYPLLNHLEEGSLNEVILEIARNTAQHSSAKKFSLRYNLDDSGLEILVGDDGHGILEMKKGHFGLRGIDEALKDLAEEYSYQSNEAGVKFRILIGLERLQP